MANLEYGDKVVCVETFGYSLAKGDKYYVIERESDGMVTVRDTKGNMLEDIHYSCFEKVDRDFKEGDKVIVTSDNCPLCSSNEKLKGVYEVEHHDRGGTMLPYLINGSWYCDECLEAAKEPTRVYKWKVGDELVIVSSSGSGFSIGTRVKVIAIDEDDDDMTYRVETDTNAYWHCEDDLGLISEGKYLPLSEQVTVTFVDRVPCKNPSYFIVKDGWRVMTVEHEKVDCGTIINSAQKAVLLCLNTPEREIKITSICKSGNVYTVAVQ